MDLIYSTYRHVWLVELALKPLMLRHPALRGPHPLWSLFTLAIEEKVVMAMPGVLWDFELMVGLACVREEQDAKYLREEWARFVTWVDSQDIQSEPGKADLN